jgi:hypothetical protein
MIKQFIRRKIFTNACIKATVTLSTAALILLSLSVPATAQTDKFDGEWLARGELNCTPKGYDSFESVITVLNSQLSGKLVGKARDYEVSGFIDSGGTMGTGHLISILLGYSPVLKATGRFGADKANISYSAPGAAGAPCAGDMILTRTPSKTFDKTHLEPELMEGASQPQSEIVRLLQVVKDLESSGLISSEGAKQKRVKILKHI